MKALFRSALAYLAEHRGTTVTLLFSLYVLLYDEIAHFLFDYFLHDSVSKRAADVISGHGASFALGIAICIAMVLELFALALRITPVGKRSGAILVWILHLSVSAILALLAVQSFGIDVGESRGNSIMVAALMVVIVKDVAILYFMYRKKRKEITRRQEIVADLFLLINYCVGFTATWSALLRHGGPGMSLLAHAHAPAHLVANTLAMVILFTMFYLPFRMGYLYGAGSRSIRDRIIANLSVALSVSLTILPLFKGHTSLESALKEPLRVERLFLAHTRLRALPPEIGQLKNLRILDISGNALRDLPAEFSTLRSLLWLRASKNSFTTLPAPLTSLAGLERIDLSFNALQTLPPQVGNLRGCAILDVSFNKVRSIPDGIAGCERLKELRAQYNRLDSLPAGITRLRNLRAMMLQNNKLSALPAGIESMPRLVDIDLRNNPISTDEVERLKGAFEAAPGRPSGKKVRIKF